MHRLLFLIFLLIFIAQKSSLSSELQEVRKNYCSKTVSYTENELITETQRKKEPYTDWCFSFPFIKCTKHRYVTVNVTKTVPVLKTKTVIDCCPGYEEKNNACVPLCRLGCGHGKCIKPDSCLCDPGWRQPFCLNECEPNRFGKNCTGICICLNGAQCDQATGFCHCTAGYTGESCELPCPDGTYGIDCKSKCECKNDAICDKVDGECECKPGFDGEYCEIPCHNGTHGQDCEEQCVCIPENTEICHHVDGKCDCKPGYTGEHCEKECDDFRYGQNCSEICKCVNSEFCDNVDGECYCKPGWTGERCSFKCPVGTFGENCSFECHECLEISAHCDHVTGACFCPPGFHGNKCEKRCPVGYWGPNCTNICNCNKNNFCSARNGMCFRRLNCPYGYWGSNCSNKCNCNEEEFCEPENGKCEAESFTDDEVKVRYVNVIPKTVCILILIAVVTGTVFIWICIRKKKLQSDKYFPFSNFYGSRKRRKENEDESIPSSSIDNPVYQSPSEVVLESGQTGIGFIRGSISTGIQYVKNNVNDLSVEKKQSNLTCALNMAEESKKIESDEKDSDARKSISKDILNDLKDAFKDIRRSSGRSSQRKAVSKTSSTAELEDDFQPENLDEFNTFENIYESPAQKVIEGICDKPVEVDNINLSVKEP